MAGQASRTSWRIIQSLNARAEVLSGRPSRTFQASPAAWRQTEDQCAKGIASEAARSGDNNRGTPSDQLSAEQRAQQLVSLKTWAAVPDVAKALGLAGLIPFFALAPPVAAHIPFLPPVLLAQAASMQVGYGAAIASFLGGIHWGAALLDFRPGAKAFEVERYVWGVTPCLLAWPALCMEAGPGAFAVAATLGVAHAVDSSFSWRGLVPPWYMSLRRPLTFLAIGGLLITAGDDVWSERKRLEERAQADEASASL